MLEEIQDLLYSLGITSNYTGYYHVSRAVQLSIETPERLLLVTKLLYPAVAKHYKVTACAVERNIRTAVAVAWARNPDMLSRLARCPLTRKPTASQFISILAAAVAYTIIPA